MPGTITSIAEVTHVFKHGFWLLLGSEELLLPFERFPWFRKAIIEQLSGVAWPKTGADPSIVRADKRLRCVLFMVCSLAALLTGCSSVHKPACAVGEQRSVSELLYFGTAKPTGVVSSEEWSAFLGSVVTPRFPQGLSAWQASGQWQSADGSLTRENSFVLNLVHPEGEPADKAIQAIVAEYKSRFRQEAVLRVKSYACVSF